MYLCSFLIYLLTEMSVILSEFWGEKLRTDSGTFSAEFRRKAEIVVEKQLRVLGFRCVGWAEAQGWNKLSSETS